MKNLRRGFTLIELIIVLAIAGLIISLVFVAARAAQRNARDTTRRADTQKLATAIEQWAANNNGALPKGTDMPSLKTNGYLDASKFKDPGKKEEYIILVQTNSLNPGFCFPKYMAYVPDSLTTPTKYSLETCLESGIHKYTP